jgi:hypothetical protein
VDGIDINLFFISSPDQACAREDGHPGATDSCPQHSAIAYRISAGGPNIIFQRSFK